MSLWSYHIYVRFYNIFYVESFQIVTRSYEKMQSFLNHSEKVSSRYDKENVSRDHCRKSLYTQYNIKAYRRFICH